MQFKIWFENQDWEIEWQGVHSLSIGPNGKPYDTREIVDLRSFQKESHGNKI